MTAQAAQENAMLNFCAGFTEALPMAVALVEGVGHVVRYVNPAFCRLLGKPEDQLIGNDFATVVPASVECLALMDRVRRTRQIETHTGQESSIADPLFWSYTIWPVVDSEDRTAKTMVLITENTPSHESALSANQALMIGSVHQQELTDTAEELNARLQQEIRGREEAQVEMEVAYHDLEQFAHAASHDLQEPLRMVNSYIQLLARRLRPHLDSEAEEYINYIVEGSRRMSALIEDLLAYAKAGDEEEQDREPVELGTSLEQALASLHDSIVETHAVITSDRLPTVNAAQPQLAQLFQNLIGNALKYRNSHGSPQIHVAAEFCETEWVISVRDNGIGFESRYAEQIFGVFKRLHSREYPGTGIGLALCRRIVERHRGRIWAIGELGKGATFFFTLPEEQRNAVRRA